MTVQLKVQIERQISEDIFRVQMEVIEAVDISFDVFVFDVEDDSFLHAATVYDLETWPATKEEAAADNLQSYRGRSFSVDFSTPLAATTFETNIRYSLAVLKNQWQEVLDAFEASSTVTIGQ